MIDKVKALTYISRILGLNHVKFNKSGIFLFDFPMFLLPIEEISKFYLNLINEIGRDEVHEILYEVGKIQGVFAISNYYQKFKISPSLDNINFFVEQVPTIGLGSIDLKYLDKSTNTGKAIVNSKIKKSMCKFCDKNHTDFYLNGCMVGISSYLFNTDRIDFKIEKENEDLYHFFVFENKNFNLTEIAKDLAEIKKIFNYRNISFTKTDIKKEVCLFDMLKRLDKNFFKITQEGAYFFDDAHFFTNMGVFSSICFLFAKHYPKSKKVIFDLGRNVAKYDIIKFGKMMSKYKNLYHELISINGFGNLRILSINSDKTRLSVRLEKSPYIIIYNRLFRINSENTDFIRGFLTEVFSFIYNKENIKVTEKNVSDHFGNQLFEIIIEDNQ